MTSAIASSTRSAGCVASSAAMISESDVERERDAALAQLGVQLDGVDQVAVVGERELAAVASGQTGCEFSHALEPVVE